MARPPHPVTRRSKPGLRGCLPGPGRLRAIPRVSTPVVLAIALLSLRAPTADPPRNPLRSDPKAPAALVNTLLISSLCILSLSAPVASRQRLRQHRGARSPCRTPVASEARGVPSPSGSPHRLKHPATLPEHAKRAMSAVCHALLDLCQPGAGLSRSRAMPAGRQRFPNGRACLTNSAGFSPSSASNLNSTSIAHQGSLSGAGV